MTPRIRKMQDDWLLRNLEQVGPLWRCSFWLWDDEWFTIANPSLKSMLRSIRTIRVLKMEKWPKSCRSAYDAYPFKGEL
jgi:hypothetical protein